MGGATVHMRPVDRIGGDVFKVGTPVDGQVAVWTGDGTVEGDTNFTFLDVAGLLTIQSNASPGLGSSQTVAYAMTQDDGVVLAVFGFEATPDLHIRNANDSGAVHIVVADAGSVSQTMVRVSNDVQLFHDTGSGAAQKVTTRSQGMDLRGLVAGGAIPDTADEHQTRILFEGLTGRNLGLIGTEGAINPGDFAINNYIRGGKIRAETELVGGGAEVNFETDTAALGGLFVNNQLTGAGIERVLTEADLSAGGGLLSSQWRFRTDTAEADPGSGRFRYDDAVYANVGEIYISDINDDGKDVSNFLSLLETGDRLYIQDESDSSKFAVWNVVLPAVLDNTGWWTISVALEREGDTLSQNVKCLVVLQIQGNADQLYLRLDATNDPITGELAIAADFVPSPLTQQRMIGQDTLRFNQMHSRLGSFVGQSNASGTLGTNTAVRSFGPNPTGLMAGNQVQLNGALTEHELGGGRFKSVICAGNVYSYSTGAARLRNNGGGASLFGSAFAYGAGDAVIEVQGPGAFITAYAYTGYGANAKNHTLLCNQSGAVMMGYSYGYGTVDVTASGYGCFLQGFFSANLSGAFSVFRATAAGSFAQGAIANNSFSGTSTLESTNSGSFAQGHILDIGTIRASGAGSFAQGRAQSSGILEATASGTFAHGIAHTNDIRAIANGAFAIGDATAGDIIASGVNSCQFGPGTNALADTFQIGNGGVRFKGTTGAPSALQNGDIWVNAGYLYFRTNGVSVKMVACP